MPDRICTHGSGTLSLREHSQLGAEAGQSGTPRTHASARERISCCSRLVVYSVYSSRHVAVRRGVVSDGSSDGSTLLDCNVVSRCCEWRTLPAENCARSVEDSGDAQAILRRAFRGGFWSRARRRFSRSGRRRRRDAGLGHVRSAQQPWRAWCDSCLGSCGARGTRVRVLASSRAGRCCGKFCSRGSWPRRRRSRRPRSAVGGSVTQPRCWRPRCWQPRCWRQCTRVSDWLHLQSLGWQALHRDKVCRGSVCLRQRCIRAAFARS